MQSGDHACAALALATQMQTQAPPAIHDAQHHVLDTFGIYLASKVQTPIRIGRLRRGKLVMRAHLRSFDSSIEPRHDIAHRACAHVVAQVAEQLVEQFGGLAIAKEAKLVMRDHPFLFPFFFGRSATTATESGGLGRDPVAS